MTIMTICLEDKDRVIPLEIGRLFTFDLCRKTSVNLQLMLNESLNRGNNTVECCLHELYYRQIFWNSCTIEFHLSYL